MRAKHALDMEEPRRARRLTKRSEQDRERREKFTAEMVDQRRARLTKSNEETKVKFTHILTHAFARHHKEFGVQMVETRVLRRSAAL